MTVEAVDERALRVFVTTAVILYDPPTTREKAGKANLEGFLLVDTNGAVVVVKAVACSTTQEYLRLEKDVEPSHSALKAEVVNSRALER